MEDAEHEGRPRAPAAMSDGRLRVLIADGNYLTREGLRAVLTNADMRVVGAAAQVADIPHLLGDHAADAVVLHMGTRMEALEVVRELRRSSPHCGVVVLSSRMEPRQVVELLKEGSQGLAYLLLSNIEGNRLLVRALHQVVGGGTLLDPVVVDRLVGSREEPYPSRIVQLTPRELDVLTLMASGLVNSAIARKLSISERAVEKHIGSIFRTLGVSEERDLNRRVAAVLLYLEHSRRDEEASQRLSRGGWLPTAT